MSRRRDGPGRLPSVHILSVLLPLPPPLTIEVVLEEPEGHVGQMIDLGGVGADVIVVGGVEADIVQCRYAGNEGGECGEDGGGEGSTRLA